MHTNRTPRPEPERRDLSGADQFLVWACRHYLRCAIQSTPVPEFVLAAFENAGIEWLYYALDRVLVCLLAAPTHEIIVHDVRCPSVALHEQALLTGLRKLELDDDAGFAAAMSVIMLPTAIRVAEPPMKLLAAGLSQIKHDPWPAKVAGHGIADEAPSWPYGPCGDRTIN